MKEMIGSTSYALKDNSQLLSFFITPGLFCNPIPWNRTKIAPRDFGSTVCQVESSPLAPECYAKQVSAEPRVGGLLAKFAS